MRAERGGRGGRTWWHPPGTVAPADSASPATPPGFRPGGRGAILGARALTGVAVALVASAWGSVRIPVETIARMVALRLGLPGAGVATWPASWETIIFTIRLPRVVLAGVVGASLALSGATYQGLFRNPLADPYLIGVASGAALGATAATGLRLPPNNGIPGVSRSNRRARATIGVSLATGVRPLSSSVGRTGGDGVSGLRRAASRRSVSLCIRICPSSASEWPGAPATAV